MTLYVVILVGEDVSRHTDEMFSVQILLHFLNFRLLSPYVMLVELLGEIFVFDKVYWSIWFSSLA